MRQIFLAEIDQLREMLKWIVTHLAAMEFSKKALMQIEVAAEEVLVNIISHAYKAEPEPIEIELKLFPKSHVEIIFSDRGPPFNPLEREAPNPHIPLEMREVGGLGIFFVSQNMDEVQYHRKDDRNVLTCKKLIRSSRTE